MMKRIVAMAIGLVLGIAMVAEAEVGKYVNVACMQGGVLGPFMDNDDCDFHFVALGGKRPEDNFTVDFMVSANSGMTLLTPASGFVTITAVGSDSYSVNVDTEGGRTQESGIIYLHVYYIKSNQSDGEKDIVVPRGTEVTYTSCLDYGQIKSKWNAGSATTNDVSDVKFLKSFWPADIWIPSFSKGNDNTPDVAEYSVSAECEEKPDWLKKSKDKIGDSGEMSVVEVSKIEGHGKSSTRREKPTPPDQWEEAEIIYAEPNAIGKLSLTLNPSLTGDKFKKIKDKIVWGYSAGSIDCPDKNDKREAVLTAAGEYGLVTASLGTEASEKVIPVWVVTPTLQTVKFFGNIQILKDDDGKIRSESGLTAWQDDNFDGTSDLEDANADTNMPYRPIAYKSKDKMVAKAVFLPYCQQSKKIITYDAYASDRKYYVEFPDQSASAEVEWGDMVTAVNPFSLTEMVGYQPSYTLEWKVGFKNADTAKWVWLNAGTSQHELYLTWKTPTVGSKGYETVFHMACKDINGLTKQDDIVEGIFNGFAGGTVKLKGNNNNDDSGLLFYYKSWYLNPNDMTASYNNTVDLLLKKKDGDCSAWAEFFGATLRVHGMNEPVYCEITLKESEPNKGFLVKTWDFKGNASSEDPEFPYRNKTPPRVDFLKNNQYNWTEPEEVEYTGNQGQNNSMPLAHFTNHRVVFYRDAYYDPSYGEKHIGITVQQSQASFYGVLGGFWKWKVTQGDFLIKEKPDNLPNNLPIDFSKP